MDSGPLPTDQSLLQVEAGISPVVREATLEGLKLAILDPTAGGGQTAAARILDFHRRPAGFILRP
jgi:hypothetical protein